MEKYNLEDKIIFDTIGLLDSSEEKNLKSENAKADYNFKKNFSEYNNLVSLISKTAFAQQKNFSPSSKVKSKLMNKISPNKLRFFALPE